MGWGQTLKIPHGILAKTLLDAPIDERYGDLFQCSRDPLEKHTRDWGIGRRCGYEWDVGYSCSLLLRDRGTDRRHVRHVRVRDRRHADRCRPH